MTDGEIERGTVVYHDEYGIGRVRRVARGLTGFAYGYYVDFEDEIGQRFLTTVTTAEEMIDELEDAIPSELSGALDKIDNGVLSS